MDDLLLDFVTESKEHLDSIEDDFVVLVKTRDNPDPELVNKVFRAIHTVKGVAGFVGQKRIGELSHVMESLLQQIKLGKKKPEQRYIDVLLEGVDQLNAMLDNVEASNDMDISRVYEKIKAKLDEEPDAVSPAAAAPSPSEPVAEDAGSEEPVEGIVMPEPEPPPLQWGEAPPADVPPPPPESPSAAPEELSIPELQVTSEMIARFTQESLDLLDEAEQCMLQMASNPQGASSFVGEAFRLTHSFKGNCGFFGLADYERLSHKMENILDMMRQGQATPAKDIVSLLLKMVDFLRNGLNKYAATGQSVILGLPGLLDLLDSAVSQPVGSGAEPVLPPAEEAPPVSEARPIPVATPSPAPTPAAVKTSAAKPAPQPPVKEQKETVARNKEEALPPDGREDSAAKSGGAARQGIRVDISKLDKLINLVGELVIAEAMVVRNPAVMSLEDEMLAKAIHHLNRVSADLQDVAMSVRMIPISGTFRKMTRLVYDVSKKAGKKVELQLEGEDTEVDKTVVEQIGDPLVHIVRNAIDHGLETPDERRRTGKPEAGTVRIEARHEGGEVWIIITDDGRGLNREKIIRKAVSNGLVPEANAGDLKDEDIFKLIFEPGFSTADQVTDISGRGVGMDVVKKNIEKLKGRVEVRSVPGKGSTFILHIPLTLAIIDGMLIRVGGARYTIPLLSIRETMRPQMGQITITPDGRETVRVREEMIPVLRLHQIFNIRPDFQRLDEGLLMIVECDSNPVALFVDELLGQNQTVIKGLSNYLGRARGISGCTILGDGEVSLILDIGGLIALLDEQK